MTIAQTQCEAINQKQTICFIHSYNSKIKNKPWHFSLPFTTTDIKSRLTTGSATGGDGDSNNDTTPMIEVVVSSGVLISVLDEIFDTLANKIVKKLADNVDDEAGDLPVVPVATTNKINHVKEEIYELS